MMWCNMGIVTVAAGTASRRFPESQEIAGFRQEYKKLRASFHEGLGKLLSSTNMSLQTLDQWAREFARDLEDPALDFIPRRLAKYSRPLNSLKRRVLSHSILAVQPAILTPHFPRG